MNESVASPPRPPRGAIANPRLAERLFRPVDGAWLAAFRVLFGTALSVSMLRFVGNGWVELFFATPTFHFKYWGFGWVEPLDPAQLRTLFYALAGLSLAVAAGFLFRVAALAFALGLTYVQLIDVTSYLNHYYLAALLAWLLACSPANRVFSLDAWLRQRLNRESSERVAVIWLYLFRCQVGVVYVFAGLAKAQGDWLVHAQPLRMWLAVSTELPLIGPLLTLPLVPVLMSWCGFLFDISIVAWLSIAKTRPYAYVVLLVFHALTALLFPIGMFPVIMSIAALVFFAPSWPRRLVRAGKPTAEAQLTAVSTLPPVALQRLALGLAGLYCAVQLLMPLRALVYGGNVLWHEQGMRFSWRVMVRAKGGATTFVVRNRESGRTWYVDPRSYLTPLQESEMSAEPGLIVQLATHIRRDFEHRGLGPVEVRAQSRAALNGRRSVPFVNPEVDLSRLRDDLASRDWVLPAPTQSPPHSKLVL